MHVCEYNLTRAENSWKPVAHLVDKARILWQRELVGVNKRGERKKRAKCKGIGAGRVVGGGGRSTRVSEGRKEGRKEGWKDGRMEGWKKGCRRRSRNAVRGGGGCRGMSGDVGGCRGISGDIGVRQSALALTFTCESKSEEDRQGATSQIKWERKSAREAREEKRAGTRGWEKLRGRGRGRHGASARDSVTARFSARNVSGARSTSAPKPSLQLADVSPHPGPDPR
jgi:hypothetical protein